MALANMRILTRLSMHIDGVDSIHETDSVVELDDAVLNLVVRDLAVVEA